VPHVGKYRPEGAKPVSLDIVAADAHRGLEEVASKSRFAMTKLVARSWWPEAGGQKLVARKVLMTRPPGQSRIPGNDPSQPQVSSRPEPGTCITIFSDWAGAILKASVYFV